MKLNKNISSALFTVLLLVAVVLACNKTADETDKANKLVDEGNAVVQDGKKFLTDAEEKKATMLRTNVSQLAEARTLANESIRAYDQAEEKWKDAAAKYGEASKLKINDKFKEYLALLIDSQSRSSFISRANAATEKAERLGKEADDLSAQAEKIQKDNPDSFKKS